MRGTIVFISILLATINVCRTQAQSSGNTRLVVDTVAALNAIGTMIEKHNAEPLNRINSLQEQIGEMDNRLSAFGNELAYLNNIRHNLSSGPKVKDTKAREELKEFLESTFSLVPEDSILAHCNRKDVEKAHKSADSSVELQKLRAKMQEKILKNAAKGDFSSGYTLGCVQYFLKSTEAQQTAAESRILVLQDEVEKEKQHLATKPTDFTASLWLELMGDQDVPTKRVIEAKAGSDSDELTFQQMVEKYYSSKQYPTDGDFEMAMLGKGVSSQREEFEKDGSAKGKFNGLITDRIGAFPAKITIQNYWEYEGGDRIKGRFEVFDKVLIESENGTVPAFEFPLGFKETLSEFSIPFVVRTINSYWDESGIKRDGISVFCNYPESTYGKMTLMYNDGKTWKITTPDDAVFLRYNESLDRIREAGHTPQILKIKETKDNYYGGTEEIDHSFLVVTNGLIGHSDNHSSDTNVILKYKNNGQAALEGYCKIEVPGFNKIYVDNYSGMEYSGQVIVAEGSTDSGNGVQKKKYIYYPGTWELEEEIDVNGTTFSFWKELVKIAEGIYNSRTGKWEIEEIAQGDI